MSQPPAQHPEPDDAALREAGWTYRPYESGSALEPASRATPSPAPVPQAASGGDGAVGTQQFVLGLATLTAGIPVSAIAVTNGGLPALIVAWAGLVGVNLAHGWARRRTR